MSFWDIFRPLKSAKQTRWKELGAYTAIFAPFGQDMWRSDLVRSCIRPIAEHTSKAHAVCNKPEIAKILNASPNMYMDGKAFLTKIRLWLEIKNTAFVYIARDDTGKPISFYPVPYSSFEALEYLGDLYIKFSFNNGAAKDYVFPWADLAVFRKDYYQSDIWGDDNTAILEKLDVNSTAEQGIANATKATANLRGILRSTKAMLSNDDLRKQKEEFVKDYLNLENSSGIASLDATQEFTPIKMEPSVVDPNTMKQLREDIQRYWGVSDNIIMSKYTEEEMEAFYQSRIEPFLKDLSEELTRKIFTKRERELGSFVIYESNRIQFASNQTKLNMVQLVDRGIMTPNELRQAFNLAPYEGGDEFIRMLNTTTTGKEKGAEDELTGED